MLDERGEQLSGGHAYRIAEDGENLILQRRGDNGEWADQYLFTLKPHEYPDYEEMCRYHQTSPESHFTRQRVCTRATNEGRITLSDLRLIVTSGAKREEHLLEDERQYAQALKEHFGIELGELKFRA